MLFIVVFAHWKNSFQYHRDGIHMLNITIVESFILVTLAILKSSSESIFIIPRQRKGGHAVRLKFGKISKDK